MNSVNKGCVVGSNTLRVAGSSILAGIAISIGGCLYLLMENRVLGAVFFSVGLLTVCSQTLHLYTGKVCYMFSRDAIFRAQLPVIWIGNFVGSFTLAGIIRLTRYGDDIQKRAIKVCNVKLSDSPLSLIMLGIFCGILIYVAVDGYCSSETGSVKLACIFFGVTAFILCGAEHCVADMFYFAAAGIVNPKMLAVLLLVTFGNTAGGLLFPMLRSYGGSRF